MTSVRAIGREHLSHRTCMETTSVARLVREGRLELPWVAPLDPKSSASASFATRAPEGLREFTAILPTRGALYARDCARDCARPGRCARCGMKLVRRIVEIRLADDG